jgi:hypothetical protein
MLHDDVPANAALAPPCHETRPNAPADASRPLPDAVSKVDTASALLEFQAVTNAQTIRDMQREHREEVSRLQGQMLGLRKRLNVVEEQLGDFETIVVEVGGRFVTLWTIYEEGLGRPLCWCRDTACDGCPRSHMELVAEYQAEARDRDE